MTKTILADKVNKLTTFDKKQILTWIQSLPNTESRVKPESVKIGDVFFHQLFQHPFVLLQKKGDAYICALLTTEENCEEILEQCDSRFFYDNFFTKVLFTVNSKDVIQYRFFGVYDNNKHLKDIFNKLKTYFLI